MSFMCILVGFILSVFVFMCVGGLKDMPHFFLVGGKVAGHLMGIFMGVAVFLVGGSFPEGKFLEDNFIGGNFSRIKD